jgi:hypothetical protein
MGNVDSESGCASLHLMHHPPGKQKDTYRMATQARALGVCLSRATGHEKCLAGRLDNENTTINQPSIDPASIQGESF